MTSLVERIEKLRSAEKKVTEHPLCARLIIEGDYFVVIYPAGYKLDGSRVAKNGNKSKALGMLYDAMERHWEDCQL